MRGRAYVAGFAAALALVGAAGTARGTFAVFTGDVAHRENVFALTSLHAPGSLTATPSGHFVNLSWTAGQNGSGYRVLGAAAPDPAAPGCSAATYGILATRSGTTYSEARGTPQGTWYCYKVETSLHSWTSVENNPVAAAQLGFVATSVRIVNGGAESRLDEGDQIVFEFNQPVAPASGPQIGNTICLTADTVVLGSVENGNCSASESSPRLGRLTGGTATRNYRFTATWTWTNGNRTLSALVGPRLSGNGAYQTGGTWTFVPTTNTSFVTSATGGLHVCDTNAGGGNCLPTGAGF